MKKQGHPPYQDILFVDSATGHKFVCGSTLQPKEKEMFQGKEYPVYKVSISSASHPFFTGSKQLVDSEGRVDKFNKRYAAKKQETEKAAAAPAPVKKTAKTAKKKT
jgi:large subunit ribosomal protein L31